MSGRAIALIALLLALAAPLARAQEAEPAGKERVWTDQQGNETRARYVRVAGTDIVFSRGSKALVVPFRTLCVEDQKVIRQALFDANKLSLLPPCGAPRTWTTLTGRTVEGSFVRVVPPEKVLVQTANGLPAETPFAALSLADRDYVRGVLTAYGEADLVKSRATEEAEEQVAAKAAADAQAARDALKQAAEEEARRRADAARALVEEERARREEERRLRQEAIDRDRARVEEERQRQLAAQAQWRADQERLRQQQFGPPPGSTTSGSSTSAASSPGSAANSALASGGATAAVWTGFAIAIGILLAMIAVATAIAAGGLKMASHVVLPYRPLQYQEALEMSVNCVCFAGGCAVVCWIVLFATRGLPALVPLAIIFPLGIANLCFPPYHYAEKLEISIYAGIGLWLIQALCTAIIMFMVLVVLFFLVPAVLIPLSLLRF